ncbi:MAG: pyruvate dehydrogenase (acetyl-transferring), homodimeric type, partial [Planctomycetota bacterium]
HPEKKAATPMVTELLPEGGGPVIAVSDFMKSVPDQIARWVPDGLVPLGTDGFGMSDTRQALRRYFEIDAASIVVTALSTLARRSQIKPRVVTQAMKDLDINPDAPNPVER